MAYRINRFDGSTLTVVEDGTVDNFTDLKIVGKNFAGYGEIQNENFIFLLENFSSQNPPPRPISGQIWFDADNSKLKFYDGSKFRTTGGAEISDETPVGLTEGDFWWDTENEQLYAYNGTDFVLVGPQDAGEGITQMQSTSLLGKDGISRSVIVSVINDNIVHIISNEAFIIAEDSRPAGFDVVKQGVTLRNTTSGSGGVTDRSTSNYVYWGTASNADKLGGKDADQYIEQSSPYFNNLVEFADLGFAVGDSNDLRVLIENDDQAVLENALGNLISLRTKDTSGVVKTPLRILSNSVLPGETPDGDSIEQVDLGNPTDKFNDVYAENFIGLSERATALVVNGNDRFGDVSDTANTIAVRDAAGGLRADLFRGVALQAKYADLAEIYSTAEEFSVGTVVSVCAHSDHEVCDKQDSNVIGVISENPAYLMNAEAEGQAIAFTGRVPVRIVDAVEKGQEVYAIGNGAASVNGVGDLVGIALASDTTSEEKLVECVLKV
jgi:hypothetical protein